MKTLTSNQKAIWFDQLVHYNSSLYNLGGYVRIAGDLNLNLLEKAISETIASADIFQQSIQLVEGEPQFGSEIDSSAFQVHDLRGTHKTESELKAQLKNEHKIPLNWNEGELFSFGLFILSDDLSYWHIKVHHVLMDGWAVSVLVKKASENYNQLLLKGTLSSPLPLFEAAVREDLEYVESDEYENDKRYWLKQFETLPSSVKFPEPTPAAPEIEGSFRKSFSLSWKSYSALNELARAHNQSTFHLFLAALYAYFSKSYQIDDLCMGTPILNRPSKAFKNTVGLFTGISPLRIQGPKHLSISEIGQNLRKQLRQNFRHQRFPLSHLVQELKKTYPKTNRLFDAVLSFEKHDYQVRFGAATTQQEALPHGDEQTPLALYVREYGAGEPVTIDLDFRGEIWDDFHSSQFVNQFQSVLARMDQLIEQPISELNLLTPDDLDQQLKEWNYADNALGKTVVEMFSNAVDQFPNQLAVADGEEEISYEVLDKRSNQLSHLLAANHISKGDIVGIRTDRKVHTIISILAILKAGGAYLPIDSNYPVERQRYMVEDAQIKSLITAGDEQVDLGVPALKIQDEVLDSYPTTALNLTINPSDSAYLIYTSGSTGQPKGVVVTHRGTVNQSLEQVKAFEVSPSDRCMLFSSLSFDSSVAEIFMALFSGSSLHICPEDTRKNPSDFEAFLAQERISYLTVTPSFLSLLRPEAFKGVRALLTGGEAVKRKDIRRIAQYCRHFNVYGPTENSVTSTFYEFDERIPTGINMPIGKPVPNTQVYILDADLSLLPIGSVGEIYLGGAQLSKGYIHRPEITAERFIASPFAKGEKLYKTGDLGKFLPDGNIVYLGRTDNQIKLRGFRIEIGEIENGLIEHPEISNAGVLLKTDHSGEGYLLAFYVSNKELSETELKEHLGAFLPEFMVPSFFHRLEKMPLSVNGKVDRDVLHKIEYRKLSNPKECQNLETDFEFWIAEKWKTLLGVEIVGKESNFFQLGGHSLKAAKFIGLLEKEQGIKVPLAVLFEHPQLGSLAQTLENAAPVLQKNTPKNLGAIKTIALTPSQKNIWLAEQLNEGAAAFNIPVGIVIKGDLDTHLFQQSLNKLVQKHEVLRAYFIEADGELEQGFSENVEVAVNLHNDEELSALVKQYIHYKFDLTQAPLLKAGLVPLASGEHLFLLSIHHLISDGWSMNLFLEDLESLYRGEEGVKIEAGFKEYAFALNSGIENKANALAWKYWQNQLKGLRPLELPYDGSPHTAKSFEGKVQRLTLSATINEKIKRICEQHQLSRFMLVQAITKLMLHKLCKSTDFALGAPVSGRETVQYHNTMGLFVQTIPFRTKIDAEAPVGDFLQQIKTETLDALKYQDFPVDALPEANRPAFNVLVSMDDQNLNKSSSWYHHDHPLIKALELDYGVSKFDLSFSFQEVAGELQTHLIYNTHLFEDQTARLMLKYWENVLLEVLSKDAFECTILDLKLADGSEAETLKYLGLPETQYERAFPLTAVQRDMYLTSELAPNEGALRTLGYLFVREKIDAPIWQQALEDLTKQEAILRTTTVEKNGKVYQAVRRSKKTNFKYIDFSSQNLLESDVKSLVIEYCEISQDVHQELVNHWLFKLNDTCYVSVLSAHHMLLDGSSFSYFYELLDGFYTARAKQQEHVKNPYTSPFYRFANDIEHRFDRPQMINFWEQHLKGVEPLNYRGVVQRNAEYRTDHINMSSELSDGVKKFCKENRIRPDLYFKGLVALIVRGVCATDTDFCLRENLFGRSKSNLNTLGCFMSTKPLRIYQDECDSDKEFADFCKAIKKEGIRTKDAGNISVSAQNKIIGNEPLSFYFNFQKFLEPDSALKMSYLYQVFHVMKEQVEIRVGENNTGFDFRLDYDLSVFNGRDFMQRLIYLSEQLVNGVTTIGALKWTLPEEERELDLWAQNPADFNFQSITSLYHRNLDSVKNSRALVYKDQAWTYGELEKLSNQLAHYLANSGVNKGDRIALICDRGPWMLTGVLACLKSGAVYIPIAADLPEQRIAYILEDAQPKLVLSDVEDWRNTFEASSFDVVLQEKEDFVPVALNPEDSAYIIYTSGTTGVPKGVEVQHKALSNISQSWTQTYGLDKERPKLLQLASFSFDVCTGDFVRSLANGGNLIICPSDIRLDPASMYQLLEEHEINVFEGTPGLVEPLMRYVSENGKSLSYLKLLIIGSDTLQIATYKWLRAEFSKDIRIINSYGVTEACIDSACFEDEIPEKLYCKTTPIGKPLHNSKMLVLDYRKQKVPVGIPGTLYIGGTGLAKGYVNQDLLTRERFVQINDEKYYATGDQVRWLPNGDVEFLERTDNQVKVRGYRIELAEIEYQLNRISEIEKAIVSAPKLDGDRQLVAYLKAAKEIKPQRIKEVLSAMLPEYMVPQHFIFIETFPLTPNGKIDYPALPGIEQSELSSTFVEPRNDLEEQMCAIWASVLNRERVGIADNFFELGGHSLRATELVSRIKKELKVKLPLNRIFNAPRIIDFVLDWPDKSKNDLGLAKAPVRRFYPLSSAQLRTYLLQAMDLEATTYNMPAGFELKGKLDLEKLKQAFFQLSVLHEVLRTSFHLENGLPVQQVHDQIEIQIDRSYEKNAQLNEVLQTFVQPFDLSKAPLFRLHVNSFTATHHLLMMDIHHIISDGVTVQVLVRDLMNLYAGISRSKPTFQYKDFAWFQHQEDNAQQQVLRNYWLSQFSDGVPTLDFPSSFPRPKSLSGKGKRHTEIWDEAVLQRLRSFSKSHNCTLQQVLNAAWIVLVHRYTGKSDLVIGQPVSGRTLSETQDMAGMFVNTLAHRYQINPNDDFLSFIKRASDRQLEGLDHQDFPFEKLVDALKLQHDRSRHPIFDVAFSYLKPDIQEFKLSGLDIKQLKLEHRSAKFDLLAEVVEMNNHLQLELEYSTDLFDAEFMEQVARDYQSLLCELIAAPEQQVGTIPFLNQEEIERIINATDYTNVAFDHGELIHTYFEKQVAQYPDKTALVYQGETLSYRDLNKRAELIASHLPQGGERIALLFDKGFEMIASILAVLKSGNCYVPIDPNYPEERINFTIKDSEASLLLCDHAILGNYGTKLIATSALKERGNNPLDYAISSDSEAYVIYTSGSTGKPKGVPITHQNVSRLFFNQEQLFDFSEKDVWTLFHSYCFDFSVWEMYGALLFGGKLIIVDKALAQDSGAFASVVEKEKVSVLNQTPSAFFNFADFAIAKKLNLSHLKQVIFGGEALAVKQLKPWFNQFPDVQLINMYGITETTVHVTYKEIGKAEIEAGWSNIGKPIPTLGMLILDNQLNIVPEGVVGEMCIYGAGLSKGYLNRPKLTKEKFTHITAPVSRYIYRSGDLARLKKNGEVEYIGRADSQVKIRGYRIEIGEINNVLLNLDQIKQSTVLAHKDARGESYLAAYYIGEISEQEVKRSLSAALPAHMIPSWFVPMDVFPLTKNGKLDVKAFPIPHLDRLTTENIVLPHTPTEKQLQSIWSEVLGIEEFGADQGFFEVGGHSLAAAKVVGKIHESFGKQIELSFLFANPSIQRLAQKLDEQQSAKAKRIPKVAKSEFYPCSSAEQRIFVIHQMHTEDTTYNIPGVFEVDGALNLERLQKAVNDLVERHDVLRTNFFMQNNAVHRTVHDQREVPISVKSSERALSEEIGEFVRPFDLEKEALFRIQITYIGQHIYLLFDIHHIICDGISMEILISELNDLYQGTRLSPLDIGYKDFASWQKQWVKGADYQKEKAYWLEQFEEEVPVLNLPTDFVRPAVKSNEGARYHFQIPAELGNKIRTLAKEVEASPFTVFLTGLKLLLAKYSGQTDLIIGTPVSGRTHPELDAIMGMMVNTLAIRSQLNWNTPLIKALEEVRLSSYNALSNQNYPFEDLLDALNVHRDMSRNPLFDVMFSYQHDGTETIRFSESNFTPINFEHPISKMDLTLDVAGKDNGGFNLSIEYATKLFKKSTIERLSQHFTYLLEQFVITPNQALASFELPTNVEKRQLIYGFNNTLMDFRRSVCIGGMFEESALKYPNDYAVVDDRNSWTYAQLAAYTGRIAGKLQSLGLKKNAKVAMMMERSAALIAVQMGILRAGYTYVYLDPKLPEDRIAYILSDCNAGLLVSPTPVAGVECEQLSFDALNAPCDVTIKSNSSQDDLAYIIYTSGTTGMPKGVAVEHKSVLNLAHWFSNAYNLRQHRNLIQMTNMSFDVAVEETLVPLMYGACVHIASREVVLDKKAFYEFVESRQIDIAQFVPSTLQKLVVENEKMSSLKILICGGERLNKELKTQVLNKGYELYNHYGPTETTVDSLVWKCSGHNARLVHRRVGANALKNPNKIAVATKNDQISYSELQFKSEQLAAFLQQNGVGKGDVVAISLERSVDLVVSILGVMIAGGAYLPIDATAPKGRAEYMLKDSKAKFIIARPGIHENLEVRTSRLNIEDPKLFNPEQPFSPVGITTEDLAYVIYTSGSTGNPKGVQIEHASLNNFLQTTMAQYANVFSDEDVCLSLTNISFDVSVCEIFISLVHGAKLFMLDRLDIYDINLLAHTIIEQEVSFAYIPPSLLQDVHAKLLPHKGNLKFNKLMVGVEPIRDHVLQSFKALHPNMVVMNSYGPTESTIYCTSLDVPVQEPKGDIVPIGRPIFNTQIYILNEFDQLQPVGVPGELCISGEGLARGYLNQPELTAEKFTMNPITKNERMYRTGDIARWLPDGTIEFVGRKDFQVKIRGFRIEPGEIENQMLAIPKIKQVLVLALDDKEEKYLCAYYTAKEELKQEEIKAHLSASLPDYMIPEHFVALDYFPLTKNEKVDRKALPVPERNLMHSEEDYVAPNTDTEKLIQSWWEETLETKPIGINMNFFELGGNSLKIIGLFGKMKEQFPNQIAVNDLFDKPTIQLQAAHIDALKQKNAESTKEQNGNSEEQEQQLQSQNKRLRRVEF
ncbi:non-ribosomal peptide synthetase [Luteibaculum oceani]|uniref:Amino acid adenylation domain-containing protein n=1 Tax=Luteibaculum oceani TaxID=1294296 RepID=A0A5C6VDY4_9FLAO|nr:non-ribosomal peptide synthetase [Luteibaculum oceani]TXC81935.1 amino acid adenylation domain-containing protein [Luteibaculum oceani]